MFDLLSLISDHPVVVLIGWIATAVGWAINAWVFRRRHRELLSESRSNFEKISEQLSQLIAEKSEVGKPQSNKTLLDWLGERIVEALTQGNTERNDGKDEGKDENAT